MKTTILISGTEEQQNKSYDKIMDREISQRTITRFYTDKEYQTKDGYVVTADFCPYTISLIEKMKNVTIIE